MLKNEYASDLLNNQDEMAQHMGQKDLPLTELAAEYLDLLLSGNRQAAVDLIQKRVQQDVSIKDLYIYVFQRTQLEIGRLWENNQISVAQEHYCSAATQLIMSMLYPRILNASPQDPSIVSTCVGGELHEIGIRMVTDFFEMEGWTTYYLGANAPAKTIITALEERQADILAISATITYHIPRVDELIREVRESVSKADLSILVGGRPFLLDPTLWKKLGADAFATDAQEAVRVASTLAAPSRRMN
jgi:methanogenic corrinoid protein MtbC1